MANSLRRWSKSMQHDTWTDSLHWMQGSTCLWTISLSISTSHERPSRPFGTYMRAIALQLSIEANREAPALAEITLQRIRAAPAAACLIVYLSKFSYGIYRASRSSLVLSLFGKRGRILRVVSVCPRGLTRCHRHCNGISSTGRRRC
jgi:hypothetical protein